MASSSCSPLDDESVGMNNADNDDDSDSDSDSDNDDEPLELKLDQHGRVLAGTSSLNFGFRSFADVFGDVNATASPSAPPSLASLRQDLSKASTKNREEEEDDDKDDDGAKGASTRDYSEGQTFWVSANAKPTTTLESIALDIFKFHTKGCDYDPTKSGAEWWTLAIDSDNADVAWHWDKDYSLEDSGVNLSPHLATVTYMSMSGAPTVMLNKTAPTEYTAKLNGTADKMFISQPKIGKHSSFDGRYLHSAPMEMSLWPNSTNEVTRYSFLVNIWLNWRPQDAIECPMSVRDTLGTGNMCMNFSKESKIKVLECDCSNDMKTTYWEFTMGEQQAEIAARLDISEIKEALRENDDDSQREGGGIGSLLVVEKSGDQHGVPLIIVETKKGKGTKRKKHDEEYQ